MFLQKDSIRNCNMVLKKIFGHDTASFSKAQTGLHDCCMNPSNIISNKNVVLAVKGFHSMHPKFQETRYPTRKEGAMVLDVKLIIHSNVFVKMRE